MSTDIRAYSDGYKVESVMTMNTSIIDGIYGTCVVYFSSYSTMDNRNGAICHIVKTDATEATSMALNGNKLYHLPDSVWKAPSPNTSVLVSTLSTYDMSLHSKYGVYEYPSPTTMPEVSIMSSTVTVSASWYQP